MARVLELFRPDEFVPSVVDIDLVSLKERGFEALMVDLDNTLLPWKDSVVPHEVAAWVSRARELGLGLCIVSNTHDPRRLERIASALEIACVSRALKPRRHGFVKACGLIGCDASRAVVVGDQLLTDILGGNAAGMHTILVQRMHRREFVGTKFSRLIEKALLALLRRGGPVGTNTQRIQSQTQDTK